MEFRGKHTKKYQTKCANGSELFIIKFYSSFVFIIIYERELSLKNKVYQRLNEGSGHESDYGVAKSFGT